MSWRTVLLASGLGAAMSAFGCAGTGGSDGGVLGNNFACDVGADGNHTCVVWSWSGGSTSADDWKMYCAQMGGLPRRGCDVAKAVGGCANISRSGTSTVTTTWWSYDGDALELKALCERSGGTFVPGAAGGSVFDMGNGNRFHLAEGIYQVTSTLSMGIGCADPTGEVQPSAGQIWALKNDDNGNIKLNFPSRPSTPGSTQAYGNEVGMPPQPAQGASCPGAANPIQCLSEPGARAFANDQGTLVRDNDVSAGKCRMHRHIVNQVTVTADNAFTALFTRQDTQRSDCGNNADCTTYLSWDFIFLKKFGL